MVVSARTLANWDSYLRLFIGSKKRLEVYLAYVRKLLDEGVPVIFDSTQLASLLGLREAVVIAMVEAPQYFYREFSIAKRSGGTRTIATPFPALLEAQRWINREILSKVSLEDSAHGFIQGRSILSNVGPHLNKRCILRMDLKEFFPSIGVKRVFSVFRRFGYTSKVSFLLSELCCLHGSLPQGAATSPVLSNIIAKRLDRRLIGIANCYDLSYTRYADDMVFSGDNISTTFLKIVEELVESEGFTVNPKKTFLSLKRRKRIVTGIAVGGVEPKLPRETRRRLRQEEHYLSSSGFTEHTKRLGISDPLYVERLIGKFAFWRQIEPNNIYVQGAMARLRTIQSRLGQD